jgi:Domain of unknown function (DUF4388)
VTQLLIVHRDADIGRQLVQLVKDYTGYESAFTRSESETLVWLRRQSGAYPRILLIQLDAPGLDGLVFGATLSGIFNALQTLFFPPYSAVEQRIEVAGSKIFPEPIDGERLIAMIERSVRMIGNAPDLFHAIDILQMCCLAKRSGGLQMVTGSQLGTVYLKDGRILHAETQSARGEDAVFDLVGWGEIEFAYDRGVSPPDETVKRNWDELLIAAIQERQRRALPEWRRQPA